MTLEARHNGQPTGSLRRQLDNAVSELFAAMERVNALRRELRAQQVSVSAKPPTSKRQRRRRRR